jgi:hypothetical protein
MVDLSTVKADVAKVETAVSGAANTVKADVVVAKADAAKVETAVVGLDSKLATFIKAHAGKLATATLVAAIVAVWKFVL